MHRVDNPREHHEVDAPGAGPQQRPRTGIGCGPRCQHIVHQHHVAAGETLAAIGKRYGITSSTIVAANNLKDSEALEGVEVQISPLNANQGDPYTILTTIEGFNGND